MARISLGALARVIPWYTLPISAIFGQTTCWICLIVFWASGNTSKDECLKICSQDDNCDRCDLGVPFFSMTGNTRPAYYVFATGLTLAGVGGYFGLQKLIHVQSQFAREAGLQVDSLCCDRNCCGEKCMACCLCRFEIKPLLCAVSPLSLIVGLSLPVVGIVNYDMSMGVHNLAAFFFFISLSVVHVCLTALQREEIIRYPELSLQRLNISFTSWRYRGKIFAILVLLCIGITSEAVVLTDPKLWLNYVGPLAQWSAILVILSTSVYHGLDAREWDNNTTASTEMPPMVNDGERGEELSST
ncbi:hypothetical protein CYMTET_32985 [Cymbomonas tetramitiformis]|uniref:Uncharacterized protein n=1 Tax=Cymbomonas tetramitiformis TaxID=36881 RepID=A0AAE0FEM1_9CHLO|nr:hypothetical protein CYMTET_32985 [Cymbomonas tetramitiformis]